jgi:hypothetical protein
MKFLDILNIHSTNQDAMDFWRESNPNVVYSLDGADGVRFWSMNVEADELEVHSFSAEQLFATDWVVENDDITMPIDSIDAARWRGLMGSARLRWLGSAGLEHNTNQVTDLVSCRARDGEDIHFGMEFWTAYDHPDLVQGNAHSRSVLTAYADELVRLGKQHPPQGESETPNYHKIIRDYLSAHTDTAGGAPDKMKPYHIAYNDLQMSINWCGCADRAKAKKES